MSREEQLKKALKKLETGGKKIGEETEWSGKHAVVVGGVVMTDEQIFQAAEISPEG